MTEISLCTCTVVIYKVIDSGCFSFPFRLLSWCCFLVYSLVVVKVSLQSGKFETYSTIYELPTGDRWVSELWLSHWRRGTWDVRKGSKVSFRGFCSAGTQGSKWGTGDKVILATHRHTLPLPSADCQSWGDEEPMKNQCTAREKICNLPSCAMTADFPINCSYMHTQFPDTTQTTD